MRRNHYSATTDYPETVFGIVERLADVSGLTWIKPNESWESNERRHNSKSRYQVVSESPYRCEYVSIPARPWLPIEYSTSYGDWDNLTDYSDITPDTFIIPPYCGGSDYSGSLVEKSNHKALVDALEAAELVDGEDFISYCGGHGTFDVAIRIASLAITRDWDSIISTIEGLTDYPLIDESLNSEMEIESQNESWESWGKREFCQELSRHFQREIETLCESTDSYEASFQTIACNAGLLEFTRDSDGDWVPEDKAGTWCWQLADYANEYWVNEQGSDSYIDMARVVKNGLTGKVYDDAKRASLAAEIRTTLERAYMDAFWSEVARTTSTPQHGYLCNRTWQHDATECPHGVR